MRHEKKGEAKPLTNGDKNAVERVPRTKDGEIKEKKAPSERQL